MQSQQCDVQHPDLTGDCLNTQTEVMRILDEVLGLGGRALAFDAAHSLLGSLPELDSMAVVTLITTLEERLGITVDDDEISGETFASVRKPGGLRREQTGRLRAAPGCWPLAPAVRWDGRRRQS